MFSSLVAKFNAIFRQGASSDQSQQGGRTASSFWQTLRQCQGLSPSRLHAVCARA